MSKIVIDTKAEGPLASQNVIRAAAKLCHVTIDEPPTFANQTQEQAYQELLQACNRLLRHLEDAP